MHGITTVTRTTFRTKLMILMIVPLAVAQLVTLFAVMRTVEVDVESRARESLVIGGAVIDDFLAARGEQLRTSVAVLAADFGLKQATATGDADTIRSVLENHSRRISADLAMLVDLDGNTVASTLPLGTTRASGLQRLIDDSDRGNNESTAILEGTAYHVFLVPLRAPTTIAWVVLGFAIDEQLAGRLASLTGLDVSIVSASLDTPSIIVTTSDELVRGKKAAGLLATQIGAHTVYMSKVPEDDTLTLQSPFVAGNYDITVVLQRSLQEAMLPYIDARSGLALFAAALLAFVTIAAVWLSTSISRPLQTLAAAAQRMTSGNYDQDVLVKSGDEIGELATSFNSLRLAISDREQRISHQALHDPVTDLPNRSMVLRILTVAIEQARRTRKSVSVLSIQLAGMGEISSTLGHRATDELIRAAAKQLRSHLSADDVLGHTGTNEFVLLLAEEDSEAALAYVERIETILATGVSLDNVNIALRTDVGIAEYPMHGEVAADLLRFASIARTDAKQNKEHVRIYESGREEEFVRRLKVVNDIRAAIRHRDIEVWYQPKISLPGGTVCGAEALVRWNHSELGFLSPDKFIPAAEQSGTICHLTRFVLEEAVKQCKSWADQGRKLRIAVNLSVRDLIDEYLPYHVLQILKDNKVEPSLLTLEVTESSIMEDIGRSVLVLECLRDIGVQVSMDDFGTGHSSLSQIRNIPLHELKIDKSFVMTLEEDSQNEAIVQTTIALARSLDLSVVAEGVETEEVMRRIAQLGCHEAQGFFLSKPLRLDDFDRWLRAYKPVPFADRRLRGRAFSA